MRIEDTIFWVGHACFYIKANDTTIFIDPFKVNSKIQEKADLVLITHAHFDHYSRADIDKISKQGTKFIFANECLHQSKADHNVLGIASPGFKKTFDGIKIEAVPAYNNISERASYHPKAKDWIGYIIDVDGTRIYHAGDTDRIPEMGELKDIDVALLPMGGTYTMTLAEGIEAAELIKPKSVVPMHYKMLLGESGSRELEKGIKSKLSNAHIMNEVQDPVYSF